MSSKASKTRSAAVLACLLVAGLACGCASDKSVSFKSGGMTHTFAEGEGSVPRDFPLPVYPGAEATGSVSATGNGEEEESRFLMLSSADPLEKVRDYYQKELKEGGWTVENVQMLPKLVSIAASKGEREANVMVSVDGEKTAISLAVSKTVPGEPVPETSGETYIPDKLTPPTD